MTYTVSGANFNKDVAAQGTSINYKENKDYIKLANKNIHKLGYKTGNAKSVLCPFLLKIKSLKGVVNKIGKRYGEKMNRMVKIAKKVDGRVC